MLFFLLFLAIHEYELWNAKAHRNKPTFQSNSMHSIGILGYAWTDRHFIVYLKNFVLLLLDVSYFLPPSSMMCFSIPIKIFVTASKLAYEIDTTFFESFWKMMLGRLWIKYLLSYLLLMKVKEKLGWQCIQYLLLSIFHEIALHIHYVFVSLR